MSIAKEAIAEIRLVASSIQVEFGCLDGSPARHNGHNVVPVGDVSVLTGTQRSFTGTEIPKKPK